MKFNPLLLSQSLVVGMHQSIFYHSLTVTMVSNCGLQHVLRPQYCGCGGCRNRISPQLRCDWKSQLSRLIAAATTAVLRPQRPDARSCSVFRSLEIGIGMYQTSSKPVDVQKFNSFQRPITSFLIIRIEPDGNLKGYYWDGSNWVLNYQAIAETCDLEPFNFILHSEFDY